MQIASWLKRAAALVVLGTFPAGTAHAAVSYSAPGSTYTQNFDTGPYVNGVRDGLPSTRPDGTAVPHNSLLQPTPWANGWADSSQSNSSQISIPGWYLHHQASQTEGGTTGNQRFRYGSGTTTTGSFYSYSNDGAAATERALGILSSSTVNLSGGRAFIGVALVNNTGMTMTSVTISYVGEQYRYGGSTQTSTNVADHPNVIDHLVFQYRVGNPPTHWADTTGASGFTPVPQLYFFSPQNYQTRHNGTGTATAVSLDGNAAANRQALSHTLSVNWEPGQTLWLRWRDGDITGNDDGIAIDDFTFTAVPEPSALALLALGGAALLARRRPMA